MQRHVASSIVWALAYGVCLFFLACARSTSEQVPQIEDQPPFVDMAEAWDLVRPHVGGGPEKRYIVEAKGGGAALLDAEGDGDLDIYWVNGAKLDDPGRGAGNALYRNDGTHGFVDIAKTSGVEGRGWGMGALSARAPPRPPPPPPPPPWER